MVFRIPRWREEDGEGIAFYIIQDPERKKTDSRPFSRRQGPFIFSCGEKKAEIRARRLVSKVKRRKKKKKRKRRGGQIKSTFFETPDRLFDRLFEPRVSRVN